MALNLLKQDRMHRCGSGEFLLVAIQLEQDKNKLSKPIWGATGVGQVTSLDQKTCWGWNP